MCWLDVTAPALFAAVRFAWYVAGTGLAAAGRSVLRGPDGARQCGAALAPLDGLPEGEPDLLGPALDAALERSEGAPRSPGESDYGVQMMTIHAAKGLEFEVVIVPDLQAGVRPFERKLLTWMERGLWQNRSESQARVTEFLVAPIQTKGVERGKAKEFVDRAYRERERQEMRRLLYVVATRTREELHLFARPEYKKGKG